ncbi:MAG: type II secretion system F family protein [Pirellulaceae bacterium]
MFTILVLAAAFVGVTCLVAGVASIFVLSPAQSMVEDRLAILTGAVNPNSKKKDTSVLSSPLDEGSHFLEDLFSRFINLRTFLQQADVPLTPTKFLMISLGIASVGVILVPICRAPLLFAPLGATLGIIPFLFVYFKRKSRLAKFSKQFPEALELISRALRAGHSLASGFNLVADEMGKPISTEFRRCFEAQNLGQTLELAIEEMTERVPNLDLRFFATAVVLQRQTGGDLAEILDKIGYIVRERFKIFGQIQALTGEGRLSGVVLLALPPVLAVVMLYLNPTYMMLLVTEPMGQQMLAGAIVMQVVGALVIRKIINIKV